MHSSRQFVSEMLKAGASGYVLKTGADDGVHFNAQGIGAQTEQAVKRIMEALP